jgi:hypothetical protein
MQGHVRKIAKSTTSQVLSKLPTIQLYAVGSSEHIPPIAFLGTLLTGSPTASQHGPLFCGSEKAVKFGWLETHLKLVLYIHTAPLSLTGLVVDWVLLVVEIRFPMAG